VRADGQKVLLAVRHMGSESTDAWRTVLDDLIARGLRRMAHAPERLHEELGADYTDMIDAASPREIAARRKAFIRKWRLKHRA
jgi:transposase-like protein